MSNSEAFKLLDRKIQKWIWDEQWDQLRSIQEEAIPTIIEDKSDVIIASATASGKTEAAILPIISNAIQKSYNGVYSIYIGPLKALINDQYRRFSEISESIDINITPWHGDISSTKKKNLRKNPSGILLITPESLESVFVNHGTEIKKILGQLQYVIIDELHSFIGNERGQHLRSLLNRLELTVGKSITRIGLSATIGDKNIAKNFLRKNPNTPINYIESSSFNADLKLQLRGYLEKAPRLNKKSNNSNDTGNATLKISNHIFKKLRGTDNLIFANSRSNVEKYADKLRQLCKKNSVPNEFWPHHGSLSKSLRETIETELKDKNKPSTAICTTTLEMGIDIGTVKSIAQIGSPPSVTSMRQRLGRSGRRGQPSILRIYISESKITSQTPPQDRLRVELVQSIAMTELLIEKWFEPPSLTRLHLSTLIQQLLSLIGQYGGVRAMDAWTILFEKGSFFNLSKKQFIALLRKLGEEDVIIQSDDKTLTLGVKGEHIVGHYSFYAAFNTPEEYQIIANGESLGTLPIVFPLIEGIYIIFAGKRWIIKSIDKDRQIVILEHSKGGKPPKFGGSGIMVHNTIREKMLMFYQSNRIPSHIDRQAKEMLQEGRKFFNLYKLSERDYIEDGNDILLFVWKGSKVVNTIFLLLKNEDLNVTLENIAIRIKDITKEFFQQKIQNIIKKDFADPLELVKNIENKENEKYDYLLPANLLNLEYYHRFISLEEALSYLKGILK